MKTMPVATINTQIDQNWELTPFQLMLISEPVLAKEWDASEEDEIWADLQNSTPT